MKRSVLKYAVLSRLLVGLLVAGLAVQWMTSAVGMGGGDGGIVSAATLDNAADRVLADLAASVCSKDKADGGQVKAAHCQHCVPAAFQFFTAPQGEFISRLALAVPIGAAFQSQTLPPSRRQPGDGPSRAPPPFA
ncbi:hypothetical protein H261_05027 [Paramagnetospirillum caucaseum]|uniref:DUF2946 domain-containing protein n=1 Tax=Paramagnetospirillum caucaseum TaxID=1244869 RepID=M2ZUP9_9PROT|nr:hypothetical protein [Paramagnetospirillum caucaseum]EME71097.1 hypothetical protein H261_05027 [Paramagnetospirillum caucaseum]